MEGNFIVIPLNFRVKVNDSPTNAIECKGINRVLIGNYQGINIDSISMYVLTI